jgi:Ran GTPase-activating protein (RanGAP) involved in mRNA processing and transport
LKISGSIEVLKARGIAGLNPKLTKEFWGSLGECRSIRVLDLSLSGSLDGVLSMMGFAIAYNAKKKGSLEYLNMVGCINNNSNLNSIYSYMCINEYDEESWYGDPNKLSKMISANYPKKFFNNLRALQLDNCAINPNFNLVQFNKLTNKEDPDLVKLIARSDRLETLSLCQTNQGKSMAEILLLALDPRRSNFSGRLKTLNLSKNSLGKEGAKILAEAIQPNESLQVLDISKNYIGVSGAQALAQSIKNHKSLIFLNLFNNKISFDGAKAIAENVLRNNTTLECLELGHNRIRDKGLKSVVENLEKNPGSKLRIIGLRFNFLTKSGIEEMFSALPKMKCPLEQIYIKNNLIDEVENFSLSQKHQDMKLKVSVDIF